MSDVKDEIAALLREFWGAGEEARAGVVGRLRQVLDGDRRDEARHYFPVLKKRLPLEVQWALDEALGAAEVEESPRPATRPRRAPGRTTVDPDAVEAVSVCAETAFLERAWPHSPFAGRTPADVTYEVEPLRANIRLTIAFRVDDRPHQIRVTALARHCLLDELTGCEEHLEQRIGDALAKLTP